MAGGLLDDPSCRVRRARRWDSIRASSHAARRGRAALDEDIALARAPTPAARALDHKLGGPRIERRYTAPSYELRHSRWSGNAMRSPALNPSRPTRRRSPTWLPSCRERLRPAACESCWPGLTSRWRRPRSRDHAAQRAWVRPNSRRRERGRRSDMYWTLNQPRAIYHRCHGTADRLRLEADPTAAARRRRRRRRPGRRRRRRPGSKPPRVNGVVVARAAPPRVRRHRADRRDRHRRGCGCAGARSTCASSSCATASGCWPAS